MFFIAAALALGNVIVAVCLPQKAKPDQDENVAGGE